MKIAVIGCGGIGGAHARTYAGLPDVSDLICLDIDLERAEALAAQHGGRAGRFPEDLPADVDGCSVATQPGAHYDVVRELLSRGIPVFCEKPLTLHSSEGTELIEMANKQGVPLMVGFKMRFEPVFAKAKEMLPALGKLSSVSVTKAQPHHSRAGHDWVLDVGALFELSSHDLDLVNWLGGLQPAQLHASLEHAEGWQAETRFAVSIAYTNGCHGSFMGGYCEGTHFRYKDLTITFIGENGYIRIERPDRIVSHLDTYDVVELDDVDTNTFPPELQNFLDVIRGKAAPFIQAEEANIVTQTIEAAREAHRTGQLQPVGSS